MKPRFVIIVLLVFALTAAAFGQGAETGQAKGGNVEEQIKALQTEILQAQMKGDIGTMEKLYADNAMIIHSDGVRSTKAQELANIKSGSQKYSSATLENQTIRIYGDTAVVNNFSSSKATVGGKPVIGKTNATRVWVKQKGTWKLVLFHVMRVSQ
jgi:uncharacterized protein (TIGR02246 family)